MSWADSRIFRSYIADMITNAVAFDYDTNDIKVALYDNDITPDSDATGANASYDAGAWVSSGNEMFQAVQWPVQGVSLGTKAVDVATTHVVMVDAADTASGSACTLATVHGCLVYETSLTPKRGLCYNYFGGANQVTNGTFTVRWSTNGIMRFTL